MTDSPAARFHGLFDDDFSMSLGAGAGDGDPADDFKHDTQDSYVNLDSLIDFYDSLGMDAPLFELSFMPGWLATNTSRVVTQATGMPAIWTPLITFRYYNLLISLY
jgi:hypothetical protein